MSAPIAIINKLSLALQNVRFYPAAHSLVQESVAELNQLLLAELAGQADFSFGFIEGKLMVNGQPVDVGPEQTGGVAQLFELLHIDNVMFQPGLTVAEIRAFLECLATKPDEINRAGGLPKALAERNLAHIQASSVTYKRIKKGEEVGKLSAADDFIKALRGVPKSAPAGPGQGGAPGRVPVREAAARQPTPGEIRELYEIRDRFQDELERRVKDAIRNYEIENKRLAFEKNRMDAVMRNVGDGVIVVGKDGNILMANPAAEKLLGKHGQAVVGQALKDTMQQEHALVLSGGSLDAVKEIEVAGKDEETRRVLRASNAVVEDHDGQTIGMVSVLSDITKMKEVEQLKSDFVANVSHELRSPLVAIQKNLAILMDQTAGMVNGNQKEFLALAKENLDRLTRMINDLLDLSKIEAGKMELKKARTDLTELVRKTVAAFTGWFREKNITAQLDLPEAALELELDADRITQVLNNLLSNALKFTPARGEIRVTVKALNPVEIAVADTGIGIAAKDQPRIFNKFEQVSANKPAGIAGTGLGLPLAREIVEKHGGQLRVESAINKGSIFAFTLPR